MAPKFGIEWVRGHERGGLTQLSVDINAMQKTVLLCSIVVNSMVMIGSFVVRPLFPS